MKKAFILLAFLLVGCNRYTGHGEKVGTIIKLSQEGYWYKTWEGEMVRGGMNGGSGAFSTKPLHFTVRDESLLPKLQEAFDKQQEIVLFYDSYSNVIWCTVSECADDNGGGNCKYVTTFKDKK